MKKEIYADGVGQIHFAGNMVRFDFITLQPGAEGDAPKPEPSERVIMPPQGFLSMFNSMQQLIDKLTAEMKNAAKLLEFEHAAYLRDKIKELKGE